jgi:predicted PurR-regulated permease PerM
MIKSVTAKSSRALTIAVIIAVIFGAYFLRHFFTAIVFAAITAYLFNPVYEWFKKRTKRSSSASSLTLVVVSLSLLVPIILILIFTIFQINHLINSLESSSIDSGNLNQTILNFVNHILVNIPGASPITLDEVTSAIQKALTALASGVLNLIVSSIGGISNFITELIIYIYVFLNFLTYKDELIKIIKKLNPLGPSMTDLYLEKMGQMTGAMTKGQFVIAFCQGFVDALILQLCGIHGIFFFLFVLLSVLSIIPLGGGIIVIPIGIGMILVGNVWQGLLVLAGHFFIVTNIDNVLRPRLVPKHIRLNPALTLLAVFSGIAMFGFLGIIIGPVIMIVIKLTIEAYLNASKTDTSTKKTVKSPA